MQSILSGLVAISVKDAIEISEEVFRLLVVFHKLMLHVPPKMMVDANPPNGRLPHNCTFVVVVFSEGRNL